MVQRAYQAPRSQAGARPRNLRNSCRRSSRRQKIFPVPSQLGLPAIYRHLRTKAIGGTRQGGTYGGYGRWTRSPDESQHLHLERPRARARRGTGRTCCCRSIVEEEDGHHESRAAATAAHTCGARYESRGSARGRPSLCTSVTVIGLFLAAPKERMKMEKTAECDTPGRRASSKQAGADAVEATDAVCARVLACIGLQACHAGFRLRAIQHPASLRDA
eukprot:scaffold14938_cov130-Isochrysis_galbana.AAC.9